MNLGLRNKVVLVTAASSGIGKSTAELFLKEDAKVVICSRSKEKLLETFSELSQYGNNNLFWTICDINEISDINNTVNLVKEKFGDIDILVNNCGGPTAGFFGDLDEAEFEFAYKQVLMSVVRFTKLVIPKMKIKNWGRIINITSIAVHQPVENLILSNTFRTALLGLSKTLSTQLAKNNITVNSVAPGYTLTQRIYELAQHKAKQTNESHETILANMTKEIPMQRMAMPEEIAAVIVFLASEQVAYITGNSIHVDGGRVKSLF